MKLVFEICGPKPLITPISFVISSSVAKRISRGWRCTNWNGDKSSKQVFVERGGCENDAVDVEISARRACQHPTSFLPTRFSFPAAMFCPSYRRFSQCQ